MTPPLECMSKHWRLRDLRKCIWYLFYFFYFFFSLQYGFLWIAGRGRLPTIPFLTLDKSWMDGRTYGQTDRTIAPTSEIVVKNAWQPKRAVSETVSEWLAAEYHWPDRVWRLNWPLQIKICLHRILLKDLREIHFKNLLEYNSTINYVVNIHNYPNHLNKGQISDF